MDAITVEGKIARAVLDRLQSITLSPPMDVSMPDVAFTPPTGKDAAWIEIDGPFMLPTQPLAIDRKGSNIYSGFFQVTLVMPSGKGVMRSIEIAGQIVRWVPRGTKLYNGGQKVEIIKTDVAKPFPDGAHSRTAITVRYRAFASQLSLPVTVPHSDDTDFTDGTEYQQPAD